MGSTSTGLCVKAAEIVVAAVEDDDSLARFSVPSILRMGVNQTWYGVGLRRCQNGTYRFALQETPHYRTSAGNKFALFWRSKFQVERKEVEPSTSALRTDTRNMRKTRKLLGFHSFNPIVISDYFACNDIF